MWKCVGKLYEQNYVIVSVDVSNNGVLVTRVTFIHNTKVTPYKINEYKRRATKIEKSNVQGLSIRFMDMNNVMLI